MHFGSSFTIRTADSIGSMPEMNTAKAELEKLAKTYETDIQTMAAELQSKVKQYDSEAGNQTDEANQSRLQEVQGMERNISAYRQQALQDLQKKEVDIYQPILEKARTAIQKVARAKGFQYVLDSATGNGVILADGYDLLMDVKKELGI